MFEAIDSPYLVPFNGRFRVAKARTEAKNREGGKKFYRKRLAEHVEALHDLQRVLYASDKHSILVVFQAMDAAGKDSTIRAVFSGVNPAGFQVHGFKKPSTEELDHDFLWRSSRRLPERGRIGVFNRSYYEEVLVVRVHPGILGGQRLPEPVDLDTIWNDRLASIADHEKHLARNGTVIVKFWLNVSRDEQRARFLSRIDEPEKNWKFAAGDVRERGHWDAYMDAYQAALNKTSRPWAPWYAIPADDKPYMRSATADILRQTLEGLGLRYPELDPDARAEMLSLRDVLTED